MKNNMEALAQELRNKADRIDALVGIYGQIENDMKFDCMEYAGTDDEGNAIYQEPCADSYTRLRYEVWQEVLQAVSKLAKN